jgi:hypothetical protein
MKMLSKIITVLLLAMLPFAGIAQDGKVQMADLMRSNGRIYVVIAVMLTILVGILLYMVRLDRKISRLEKDN